MLGDDNTNLGGLIKEAAEELGKIQIAEGVNGDTRLFQLFDKEIPREMSNIYKKSNISENWISNGSCGSGRRAAVPWCRIADPQISASTTKGIYIVYLFSQQIDKVYLALGFGITEKKEEYRQQGLNWEVNIRDDINKVRKIIPTEQINDFETNCDEVNLGNRGEAKNYKAGIILFKEYLLNNLPSNDEIESDFIKMMKVYKSYIDRKDSPQDPYSLDAVETYIRGKGFCFSRDILQNFYISLRTKPFVILAGISGTGKSQIVRQFADAISATYKLVPVRPDWTDSSDIFGHLNLSGTQFINDSVIEFILEANQNLERPYFLCLDEMNLARVEYYFADFLSIIETRHWDEKHEHIVSDPLVQDIFDQYKSVHPEEKATSILLSDNIYVIGTVNMDESTFPFSKKVLDRANTIEFNKVDISISQEFWKQNTEEKEPLHVPNSELRSMYLLPKDIEDNKQEQAESICSELQSINDILSKANLHVGFRVRNEILFYCLYSLTDNANFKPVLDIAIMQKLLPRIQGSGKQLKDMIRILICHLGPIHSEDEITGMSDSDFDNLINSAEHPTYPTSYNKLKDMLLRLKNDGYTAFWI